jgi:hypothetical protein
MGIEETVGRLERIPGAVVGRGPHHPVEPEPSLALPIAEFLDGYPDVRRDGGYVEFLEKYAGAMIKNDDETQIVDILGFSDASTEIMEMDGPIVDDNGFLLFAQGVFHIIADGKELDMYEHDFAFDASGDRRPGVYHSAATLRSQGQPFTWYADDFDAWLAELVEKRGQYGRPALD